MAGRRVAEFFDSYAHDFSAIYGTSNHLLNRIVNRLFRKSMMIRYRRTIEGCDPIDGRSVIDVGCGPGHYSIALAKRGAEHVFGLDFAPAMIKLATENARNAGVEGVCEFVCGDFDTYDFDRLFDYAILMGFMDYVVEPDIVIRKALSLASTRAFFSFPAAGGFLAWQRRLRYKRRCDLFLYGEKQLRKMFSDVGAADAGIERVERDFFVTVDLERAS